MIMAAITIQTDVMAVDMEVISFSNSLILMFENHFSFAVLGKRKKRNRKKENKTKKGKRKNELDDL